MTDQDETQNIKLFRTPPDEFQAAAAHATRTLAMIEQTALAVAKARKALYDSYRLVGFEHDDAIDMCMDFGM